MRRRELGQAVAETVLVLPILLWVLLATIGFGYMLYAKTIVVLAADFGGREAAIAYGTGCTGGLPCPTDNPTAEQDAVTAAQNVLSQNLHHQGTVQVSTDGTDVTVQVDYSYAVFVPGIAQFFPNGTATLASTADFLVEPQP